MYVMYMVRKQLYIEERHEKALKRRAKALGVSEADIVREALDLMFREAGRPRPLPGQTKALSDFLKSATEFAATQKRAVRYRRTDLYEERESRWRAR